MLNEHEEKESLISELTERVSNGIFKENPTFVLLLGMCPTLAVTTSAKNGLGMGITTLVVLALSNLFISLLRKIIPDKIRIPAFIVIIASFVTIVELLLNAYIPSLYKALGLYIPLIVVNCIILGRAEAYAYSHRPLPSLFDGIGMGMGFTIALTIIGAIRELLGAGTVFGAHVMPKGYVPVSIFIMAPGAFFVLAILTAIQNKVKEIGEKKGKDMSKIQSGCGGNCLNCDKECKVSIAEPEPALASSEESASSVIEKEKETVPKAIPMIDPVAESKIEPETESVAEPVKETVKETEAEPLKETASTEDTDLELLDFADLKKTINKTEAPVKKPVRKRASLEKAQAMLNKAEEESKEGEKND